MTSGSPSLVSLDRFANGLLKVFPYEPTSWRRSISQSGLPDDVQQLIFTVIRKSRLFRYEKIEVVHELISHFWEGQQSGHSFSDLVDQFGDPALTARMIHRSKSRSRPIMFRAFQFFGGLMLAAVVSYLVILAYFHSGRPKPTTDFMVDFNQPMRDTAEQDRAWPIYRPVWIQYGFSEGGKLDLSDLFHPDGENRYGRLIKPGDPGWPAAVARLTELQGLLDAFRLGADRPGLGLELHADISKYSDEDFAALFPDRERGSDDTTWSDSEQRDLLQNSIIGVLLPHIQSFRTAARIFVVDTRWAVEQNDSQHVVQDIQTMLGLARQSTDSNTLVGTLVGFAVAGMAFNQLEEVLVEAPGLLQEPELAELQRTIENISLRDWVKLEGERAMLHDIIQRVYTDDGNGNGRITSSGLKTLEMVDAMHSLEEFPELDGYPEELIQVARKAAEPASLFVMASRKETTQTGDALIDVFKEEMAKPFWESRNLEVDEFLQNNRWKHAVLARMFPAVEAIKRSTDRTVGRLDGVIAAIAIHRYHLKYGQWPDSFDQISPEFVAQFPLDQINGEFLKFKIDEVGPIVYSVGNDRDDDGGILGETRRLAVRYPAAHYFPSRNSDTDGDWILWPQVYFGADSEQ